MDEQRTIPRTVLITCQRCGKQEIRHPRTKYCGVCARLVNREQIAARRSRQRSADTRPRSTPRPKEKPKKPTSLAEINRAAREAGMTYGRYMEHLQGGA